MQGIILSIARAGAYWRQIPYDFGLEKEKKEKKKTSVCFFESLNGSNMDASDHRGRGRGHML